jgi:hypothetical protein
MAILQQIWAKVRHIVKTTWGLISHFFTNSWRMITRFLLWSWQGVQIRFEVILLVALYLVLIGIGIVYRFPGSWQNFPSSWTLNLNYVATRQLEPNYRLTRGDLKRPESIPGVWGWLLPDRETLADKYVKNPISRNGEIEPTNLLQQPIPVADQKLRLVLLPLDKQPQLCTLLTIGSYVDVMSAKQPVASQVRVHDIEQTPSSAKDKASAPCFVLLEADMEKEQLLASDQLHLVVISK